MRWVGSTIAKVLKFESIILMHLKHGQIRFGGTKQLNLLVVLGRVGWGPNFSTCSGLGWVGLDWVSQLMGSVGSGHTKWTHGQLRNYNFWTPGKHSLRALVHL